MAHFTFVSFVAKPLNRIEAKGDLVIIQTLLLSKCKRIPVSIKTKSPTASLRIKGLATKPTTIKWPIIVVRLDRVPENEAA